MRKLTIKVLGKSISILTSARQKLTYDKNSPENIRKRRAEQWFKDDGDRTLRLNYDNLDSTSLVMDLGGYEGQWASDIFSMYDCSILVFEPYLPFADKIEARFKKNPKIKIFKFGLGARTEEVGFSNLDNASSMFSDTPHAETISIVSVLDFLETNNISSVDLIKINIEGGEYDLLETLIDNGRISIFKNIQVQFHDFVIDNAEARMKKIQNRLSDTHQLTYHYEFVWDNWELKNKNIINNGKNLFKN